MTSLFAALCCTATLVIKVPSPTGGYVNAGDVLVILGSFLLGPYWGCAASGLGSALSDLISGYPHYIPGTFIIKALMALVSGIILRRIRMKKLVSAVIAGAAAEVIMISGYLLYSGIILGYGAAALASVPGNCVQGVFGLAAGSALYLAISDIPGISSLFD